MQEEYLIASFNKGGKNIIFPEIMVYFMILNILSTFSRYYVYEWGIENVEDKEGYSYIINNFLKFSERKFPNIVLNLSFDIEYVFTNELYVPFGAIFEEIKGQISELIKEQNENI